MSEEEKVTSEKVSAAIPAAEEAVTVAAYTTNKIPPFWKPDPELWFSSLETLFARNKITNSATKFQIVVTNLEFDVMQQAADIVKHPPDNPYESLKGRLISTYSESENKRITQLLEGKHLGEEKPSQLLRQMQQLAGDTVAKDMVKMLWIRSLPVNMQAILQSTGFTDPARLADIADKIHEVVPIEISSVSSLSQTASTSNTSTELITEVRRLANEVAELKLQTQRDKPQVRRNRSRSRPRRKTPSDPNWLCYYHYRFRHQAKNVKPHARGIKLKNQNRETEGGIRDGVIGYLQGPTPPVCFR